jgi:hypothetical protein
MDTGLSRLRQEIEAGREIKPADILKGMLEVYEKYPAARSTRVPLLGMLSLKGEPYSLQNHFHFEPMYKVHQPKRMLLKCARQVAKTTNIAAVDVLLCASTPYLRTLAVAPRADQVSKLSTIYVRPFIQGSLIRPLLVDTSCTQGVLQRSLVNGSAMFFSFAFLDCERVRGISCDWEFIDEVQDVDYDFLPIIHSCMDASALGVTTYSGTPKTLDNGIQFLWQDCSQGEWVTPCYSCGHWNMASLEADLVKMIGLHTVVCAKCQKPINPREGHWYHVQGKDKPDFHGYHIPQVIMPPHYENPEKWHELTMKMNGGLGYDKQKFHNEVLGESADMGIKLITITDIKNASVLGPNVFEKAVDNIRRCKVVALGVDWGGGGVDEVSYTTLAIVGLNPITGNCECHYCQRFNLGMTHDQEAKALLDFFRECGCQFFAHDYGGSGSVRETLMIQAGLPLNRIMGFTYVRAAARDIVVYVPPARGEIRGYHSLDKARSLVLQAVCLKSKLILLPQFDTAKDVTCDLLALMEDKHNTPAGSDVYLIRRQPKLPDDFAHALNYACMAIWHTEGRYPDLSMVQDIKLTEAQLNFASPPKMEISS